MKSARTLYSCLADDAAEISFDVGDIIDDGLGLTQKHI
jgi:hypothetical protein